MKHIAQIKIVTRIEIRKTPSEYTNHIYNR